MSFIILYLQKQYKLKEQISLIVQYLWNHNQDRIQYFIVLPGQRYKFYHDHSPMGNDPFGISVYGDGINNDWRTMCYDDEEDMETIKKEFTYLFNVKKIELNQWIMTGLEEENHRRKREGQETLILDWTNNMNDKKEN